MNFLLTVDVELTSIEENREKEEVAPKVMEVGLPRVLEVCRRLDVPATFYFTANFVELAPESMDLVRGAGHEVGCHGLTHDPRMAFDSLPLDRQRETLEQARRILEGSGAGRVVSFRSPEARIVPETIQALSELGFTSDSSICPQRFDGFLSRGFGKKVGWMFAPRRPYFLSRHSTIVPGDTQVLEVPISALIIPFIGSTMRIAPGVGRALRRFLFWEARRGGRAPVVFVFHPNECLDYSGNGSAPAGAGSGSPISDRFRTIVKVRNMGRRASEMLSEVLSTAKAAGFEFKTVGGFRGEFAEAGP